MNTNSISIDLQDQKDCGGLNEKQWTIPWKLINEENGQRVKMAFKAEAPVQIWLKFWRGEDSEWRVQGTVESISPCVLIRLSDQVENVDDPRPRIDENP